MGQQVKKDEQILNRMHLPLLPVTLVAFTMDLVEGVVLDGLGGLEDGLEDGLEEYGDRIASVVAVARKLEESRSHCR